MKRLFALSAILVVLGFQNCSQKDGTANVVVGGYVNGDNKQGVDVENGDGGNGDSKQGDFEVGVFALADETNSCAGATSAQVKVQAKVRLGTQGLTWDVLDCKPRAGLAGGDTVFFESRLFRAAVVDNKLLQASTLAATKFNRAGMYDIFCTNAPAYEKPPTGQPRIEVLVAKGSNVKDLERELPGKFVTGAALELNRKIYVRTLVDAFSKSVNHGFVGVENRPAGKLAVTFGDKTKATGNYVELLADDAQLRAGKTVAKVSLRSGTVVYKNVALRCFRNRNAVAP